MLSFGISPELSCSFCALSKTDHGGKGETSSPRMSATTPALSLSSAEKSQGQVFSGYSVQGAAFFICFLFFNLQDDIHPVLASKNTATTCCSGRTWSYMHFFLLLAAKVRSSCEEGPGQSALQSAYHNPKLDVTELKQNRTSKVQAKNCKQTN